ncbi:dicarboxylate/amino acid:cation symporter [Paenibacillus thermoaerophilus]|uniref:Dicarboxylate/amino acid:cation symporter n=1 Tax=Paenibacillus thermoaerophilus TaxID=1215385 RepID=A0ABW2V3G3_9BACL|nr:dicarboxylate/amino acid:cation symporter [Paenibacillus thermoaerophilus]TMV14346.1 dicarboxylate/amino acid:cation symporter [Paenibacillus thermoaerophilus]
MENNLVQAFQDNWIALILSIVVIGFLYFLARKRVGFGTRVFVGLGLGLLVGVILNQFELPYKVASTIGTIYVNLIKMLVIPLVLVLVINSISSLANPGQLRKLGLKTFAWFLGTTGAAAIIGLLTALVFNPGSGIEQNVPADYKSREIPTFSQVILDLVPVNPFSDAAAGKVVPILIFGLFIAVAIVKLGAKNPDAVAPVKAFIGSATQVLHQVVKYVIRLTPYGVYALIAAMAARYGLETLKPLANLILTSYVALAIHFVLVFGGLVLLVLKVNPIKFFRKAYPTIAVAFTTRSSYATLPVNLEVITKRLRVSPRIASFVAPLGATVNFNGCGGVWPAIVTVFVAQVYNIDLALTDYILLVLVAMISSIGVAGVPGPAAISTTVVLTALGLPLEGMALVLGVEALIDMGRTAVNATGTTVTAALVADSEGEFDRGSFDRGEEDELDLAHA